MKILIYDIEISPNIAYTWPGSMYERDVLDVRENWQVLSIAWKFLGDKEVRCISKQYDRDDRRIVGSFHKVLAQADIVVAHNGASFDNKNMNSKFLEYGHPPPRPYKTVDTLQWAKLRFRLNSNKLDDLGRILKCGRKIKNPFGFDLWLDVMSGKSAAWRHMIRYNKQDVNLLEKVYLKLRPWIEKHPNVGLAFAGFHCPKCGSAKVQSRGCRPRQYGWVREYQCRSCGGWGSTRHAVKKNEAQLKNPG